MYRRMNLISIQFDLLFGPSLKIGRSWLEYLVPLLKLLKSSVENVQESGVGVLPLPFLLLFVETKRECCVHLNFNLLQKNTQMVPKISNARQAYLQD
jgi:hypothetical protein